METLRNSLLNKTIYGLRKAALELEEFQLQLALGKAEASEVYEDMKKRFNEVVQDVKLKLDKSISSENLKTKLEELQLHLALGKAVSKEIFYLQKENILKAIHDIENKLRVNEVGAELYAKVNAEIEKFKIKMEILALRYELGNLETKEGLEARKKDFARKVEEIKQKFSESALDEKMEQISTEIKKAYVHLKEVFTKL
jgi:hypothetical protein